MILKKSNFTILSMDFGTKKIGIAIGQSVTCTASLLNPIPAKNSKNVWILLKKIIIDWNPKLIIVGLPLDAQGNMQHFTFKTIKFANCIKKKFNIQTMLHDERFSTTEAKIKIKNLFEKNIIQKTDSVSAAIILESWFYSKNLIK